jgi:hypothetical protein
MYGYASNTAVTLHRWWDVPGGIGSVRLVGDPGY